MFGCDDAGHAAMARYAFYTAGHWRECYCLEAFMWFVPVEHREHYTDVYPISLVKGCLGEIAEINTEI
jgi:hypothetical protein